jgi:hypothetical protein
MTDAEAARQTVFHFHVEPGDGPTRFFGGFWLTEPQIRACLRLQGWPDWNIRFWFNQKPSTTTTHNRRATGKRGNE